MAKKSGKKDERKGRRATAKSDRELLVLGEDLLTAVHLHRAVQEDEVRAALASAQGDLVEAAGDLVTRIAERFLDEAGANTSRRDRAQWPEDEAASPSAESDEAAEDEDLASPSH